MNGSVIWCTLSASLALASGVSTTSPSTPAVRRPALRSVTRRTLTSVLVRERSISFCRLRTLFRSPAFDAVKIRCRSRRTSSSARRQSTRRQSKDASSGPFTTTIAVASNLSSGSGVLVIFSPQAHLTASARFRARALGPVSGRLCGTTAWRRRPTCPGFPLPFGCRRSLLGHPMPAEELGPPCGRLTGHAPTDAPGPRRGYHVPHARATAGVGPLSTPRTTVLSRSSRLLDRHLPLLHGQSLHPAPASHLARLCLTRHQRGFKQLTRPVFPSPVAARVERAATSAFPRASHPLTGARRRTPRWGQAIEHGPGTTRSTSHLG